MNLLRVAETVGVRKYAELAFIDFCYHVDALAVMGEPELAIEEASKKAFRELCTDLHDHIDDGYEYKFKRSLRQRGNLNQVQIERWTCFYFVGWEDLGPNDFVERTL